VPRSLIAELIADGTLEAWLGTGSPRVLDLCTGNGSLAVLAALAWPEATVTGTDISAEALTVARQKCRPPRLAGRITWPGRRLGRREPGLGRPSTSCCATRPTSIAPRWPALPAEYRAEPALALDGNAEGGEDGMDFVRRLIAGARPT